MIVGLCVERSIEMVVGLLGILKAGGAYLPLDPEYPPERLAFMLEDAQASVLLTQSALRDRAGAHTVVFLDQEWARIAAHPNDALPSATEPQHLAYVIYTSGSTGVPKGVLVTHSCVTRLFAATETLFEFDSSDVLTAFHSFAFDFSVWRSQGARCTAVG